MTLSEKDNRQLRILQELSTKDLVSGSELRSLLGVSLRTIYRDIEELVANGILIEGTTGIDGGYRLRPEASVSATNSPSADDLFSLSRQASLQSRSGKASPLGLTDAFLFCDLNSYLGPGVLPDHVDTIRFASREGLAVELKLLNETGFVFCPFGIVLRFNDCFVVGSDISNEVTAFPISCLEGVSITKLSFPKPRDFDLRRVWAPSLIDIRFRHRIVLRIGREFDAYARSLHWDLTLKEDCLECEFTAFVSERFAWWIISQGADWKVMEPACLASMVQRQLGMAGD
jgi:predicted DNA-binding transcriptional regulator YafY